MFMTEDQKKYYKAMKKLGSKKPMKPVPRPSMKWQAMFFDLVTNQKFEMAIMVVIGLNLIAMATEHDDQDEWLTKALKHINEVFIGIFTVECVLKLIGLRWHYFKQPWNVFDFSIVIMSICSKYRARGMAHLPPHA